MRVGIIIPSAIPSDSESSTAMDSIIHDPNSIIHTRVGGSSATARHRVSGDVKGVGVVGV